MPPAPSSSSSPPTSPRTIDDLLTLSQQLTPTKSPRTIRKLRQQIQAHANEARQENIDLKRRAADACEQADAVRKPSKKRKRGDRACDADASEVNPATTEARTRHAGRLFALTKALFLIDDEVFDQKLDEEFDFSCEFESLDNELQGQLYDIVSVLPVDVKSKIHQEWVQRAFTDGQDLICATFHTRIRTQALHAIVDNPKSFATSASRLSAFSKFIGYKPATKETVAHYDRFAAPILYDKWEGRVILEHLFRGPILLKVFVSLIRGPNGAIGLFEGKSKRPQARCLERIYKLTCITPGAITVASILAIWLHSADTQLVRIGDETAIDYGLRHRVYIRRIREGLRDRKSWALGLIDYWNRILFPNRDEARSFDASGREQPENDDDLDDIFDEAPSMEASSSSSPSNHNSDAEGSSPSHRSPHRTSSLSPPSSPTPVQNSHVYHSSSQSQHPASAVVQQRPAQQPSTSNPSLPPLRQPARRSGHSATTSSHARDRSDNLYRR
ncbi:hypothetical protein MVEN_01699100 [Mycena venus]|uniref:Uncharacterized protein n=1 Tax=Mycena venus TaxID=2733690 RepID=A0A8H7CNB8_9AGAR|nr:hypothetical protein MVEN_01699100 [Mycena venus]